MGGPSFVHVLDDEFEKKGKRKRELEREESKET